MIFMTSSEPESWEHHTMRLLEPTSASLGIPPLLSLTSESPQWLTQKSFVLVVVFCFCFAFSRAAPAAYGSSQARGQIGAAAAGPRHSHSHSHTGLEPHL